MSQIRTWAMETAWQPVTSRSCWINTSAVKSGQTSFPGDHMTQESNLLQASISPTLAISSLIIPLPPTTGVP